MTKKEHRAPECDGTTDIETYLVQFENIARKNGWDDEEKALNLIAILRGNARMVLPTDPRAEQPTFEQLSDRLRQSFGPVQHSMYGTGGYHEEAEINCPPVS